MCLCGSRSSADPARSIASRRARTACNVRGARTGGPAYRATLWPAGRLLVRVPKQPIRPGDVMVLCAIRELSGVRPTLVKAAGPGRPGRACALDHTELGSDLVAVPIGTVRFEWCLVCLKLV